MQALNVLNDQFLIILTIYAVLAVLSCFLSMAGRQEIRALRNFVIISIGAAVLVRAPILAVNAPYNSDEGQMLANAIKFLGDWNSWRSVDTTSSGPLNSMILTWPALLGWDISIFGARLTQLIALICVWSITCAAIKDAPTPIVILTLASMMLAIIGSSSPDFLHYSSEMLPIVLLTAAVFLTFRLIDGRTSVLSSAACGALLGAAPFAKIQALPVAAVLGCVHLALAKTAAAPTALRNKLAVAAALGAMLPGFLILTPLLLAGGFDDFWKSYVLWSLSYVGRPTTMTLFTLLASAPLFGIFALGQLGIALPTVRNAMASQGRIRTKQILCALFLAASVCAVVLPGRPFPHYLWFLLAPLALMTGCLWLGRAAEFGLGKHKRALFLCGAVVLLGLQVALASVRSINLEVVGIQRASRAGNLLRPVDERSMLVWGWMPEWYVHSGIAPAARDIITYNQITRGALRGYFRTRMMADISSRLPDYVIDAVAPGSFHYYDPWKQSIASFPRLNDFIINNYLLISRSDPPQRCPRIYAARSLAEKLAHRYVRLTRPRASASYLGEDRVFTPDKVLDGVTFESCADRWLLPDGELGSLSVDLETAESISAVELLNTRNGSWWDRATRDVRIELRRAGTVVHAVHSLVRRYPTWTVVQIPAGVGVVDGIQIHVLQYVGLGGGLNEVRARSARR